ncbi:MAG: PEP-CTERM sorting domain-containing protein [Planctomycetes bacterium]|nr:PEP-CTERM sorting domain-containing protein [Planctomycetota bacterium]
MRNETQQRQCAQRLGLAAIVCALLMVSTSSAAVLYDTTFPESTGILPTSWVLISGSNADPGWHVDSGNYVYNGTSPAFPASVLDFATVFTDGSTAGNLVEAIYSAQFSKTGPLTGLVAHHNAAGDVYYHARINGNNLEIYRFNGGTGLLASAAIAPADQYVTGQTWTIAMTTLGGKDAVQVGALLYDENGKLVAQARTTDNNALRLTSGTAGVRGGDTSSWETFNISTPKSVTTAVGNGADTYVEFRTDAASSAITNFGNATTALVKAGVDISPAREIYRKSYLRFDTSAFGHAPVFSASLDLQTNGNNSTGVSFTVYGLNNGATGDAAPGSGGWIEGNGGTDNSPAGEITWNNAPANSTANNVDLASATLLGTFTGGVNDEQLRFTSEALVNFLNADTNNLVTFIIVQTTAGGFGATNFLQFDTKEQSGGVAPKLSLVLIPEPTSLALFVTMLLALVRRRREPVAVCAAVRSKYPSVMRY